MKKIKTVSLDVGNTLLKSKPDVEEIYFRVLGEHGCTKEKSEVGEILFASLEEYERKIFKEELDLATNDEEEEEWWRRVDAKIAERCEIKGEVQEVCRQLWEEFKKEESWQTFPEVISVLTRLREEGYRLGVTSNWNSNLPSILKAHGIAPLLDFQVVSTEVGFKKPSLEIYKRTIEMAECDSWEIVHVGDHLDTDYQGALRAEMKAILLDRGKKSKVDGPVISSLEQLPKLLADGISGVGELI